MFNLPIIPLQDRVIISDPPKPPKAEERMLGGVIIPADVKGTTLADIEDHYYEAEVLAVGPECKRVLKGMRVVIARRNVYEVKWKEHAGHMIREADIVAVLD